MDAQLPNTSHGTPEKLREECATGGPGVRGQKGMKVHDEPRARPRPLEAHTRERLGDAERLVIGQDDRRPQRGEHVHEHVVPRPAHEHESRELYEQFRRRPVASARPGTRRGDVVGYLCHLKYTKEYV